jgi:hypothetical protein
MVTEVRIRMPISMEQWEEPLRWLPREQRERIVGARFF